MCTARTCIKLHRMAPKPKSAVKSWEYPKNSGIFIKEVLNRRSGMIFGAAYQVVVPAKLTGRLRERKQFKTRAEAEACADEAYSGHAKQGQDFLKPTLQDRCELIALIPALREKKFTVSEAPTFALKHLLPTSRDKKLSQIIDELIASKRARNKARSTKMEERKVVSCLSFTRK